LTSHFLVAQNLYHQGRCNDALNVIHAGLSVAPHNARLVALCALCNSELGRHAQAKKQAQDAIATDPGDAYCFHAASIVIGSTDVCAAEPLAYEAVRLDQTNPSYLAVMGHILLAQKRWREALYFANLGLSLDANHRECYRVRSEALSWLGHDFEALAAAVEALHVDPDSALAHAQLGWAALRAKDYGLARTRFEAALKIDPNESYSRKGLIEVLRNTYWLYRVFFRTRVGLARSSEWVKVLVVLVSFAMGFGCMWLACIYPVFMPLFLAVISAGIFAMYARFLDEALGNVMLLFHPLGRLLIGRSARLEAGVMFGFYMLFVLLAAIACVTPLKTGFAAFFAFVATLVTSIISRADSSSAIARAAVFWSASVAGCAFIAMALTVFPH
jgi:tetratricopeptide (TPR) repeat protein